MPDLHQNIKIRSYHPSDLTSLYRICLKTADSGSDASNIYKDPDLVGHFYAAPYVLFEPELTIIAALNENPYGYILGTKNSTQFYDKCEQEWFPTLRLKYPIPAEDDSTRDAKIIRLIHNGIIHKQELVEYPAHLHIDLLPEIQGKGLGRKMIELFINKLSELDVKALHLETGKSNTGAIKFYERLGFHIIKEYEKSIAFGMKLMQTNI